MELILKLVISYLWFVEIIDSKLMRIQPNDELYLNKVDPSVKPYMEYISITNLYFEQIDDEIVEMVGYGLFIKSMNPKMFLQLDISTKHFENSVWNEAPFRITIPSLCQELLNPNRFWYNITKLWTNCPPQKGDKWEIEHQAIDVKVNFPPSIPNGSWQAFITLYQLGSIHKWGLMIQVELTEVARTVL